MFGEVFPYVQPPRKSEPTMNSHDPRRFSWWQILESSTDPGFADMQNVRVIGSWRHSSHISKENMEGQTIYVMVRIPAYSP
jgi:hypothetical protein